VQSKRNVTVPSRRRRLSRSGQSTTRRTRSVGYRSWSMKKGRAYATILVDLERRRPIDLLADASAASLATWLKAHPGVEIICRDRGGAYADGARQGAPAAVQVADRWHLLANLGDILERLLARHHAALRTVRAEELPVDDVSTPPLPRPPRPLRAPAARHARSDGPSGSARSGTRAGRSATARSTRCASAVTPCGRSAATCTCTCTRRPCAGISTRPVARTLPCAAHHTPVLNLNPPRCSFCTPSALPLFPLVE